MSNTINGEFQIMRSALPMETPEWKDEEEPVCQCNVAVKIKDGGQVCQLCHLSAYENHYVFAHTPEGKALLNHNENPDGASGEEIASIEHSVLSGDLLGLQSPDPTPTPAKRRGKQKAVKTENPLLSAIQFIQLAQRPKGDPAMTHCAIRYGAVVAFDRTIAAGASISQDDLACYPDTALLAMALMRVGDSQYRIIQLDNSLFIESSGHSFHVPISSGDGIVAAMPDPEIAPLGDAFRESLKVTGKLVKDSGAQLMNMAVQLNPYTTIASDGKVILEAYHGFDFPPTAMLVPKRFVDAIKKTKKVIRGFGYSEATFTVWFADGCWLRTNLYRDRFSSDLVALLNEAPAVQQVKVPDGFFDAAEYVAKFNTEGRVFCFDGRISSHRPSEQHLAASSTFAMNGFADERVYLNSALKSIRSYAEVMAWQHPKITLFSGGQVRGALLHEVINRRIGELTGFDDIPF